MKFLPWSFTESKFEFWNGEILRGFLRRLDPLKELDMAENEPMLRSWNLALPYFTVIWVVKYNTLAGLAHLWAVFWPFGPAWCPQYHVIRNCAKSEKAKRNPNDNSEDHLVGRLVIANHVGPKHFLCTFMLSLYLKDIFTGACLRR